LNGGGDDRRILFRTSKMQSKAPQFCKWRILQKSYIVTCNASGIGIDAALEQESEHGTHSVASAARKLSSAEKNYPVLEREFLAVVYALKEWSPYLHGSRFVIKTDHHPLGYLDTRSNLSKRQMRWMETLQEYDYEILYVQGKLNIVADALYRINESPSTALYIGSEIEDDSGAVALNVVGTVSRPMLSKFMVSDLLRAYKADTAISKDF
jgi:hypothetical protein